ncbi:retrovirus-related Pol polyprotein from transposon opus [Trichonephila inaurata madagascariensis]|uniref:Retrovirus-related Pol polyprotein from transposon opus n=1 Tax=Trichonephila inaurata madagascariensis TaxID=2747483 RepID=A0A8X6IKY6_9ARAC|nr:retrovirus-related Pol polyprotein from transposon opus [Trichonephila inaurata madagascariensis]
MAYLGKARKEDLRLLAEELNLNVGNNMKIADLSKIITTHPDYDEEFSKNLLTIIVEDRKLREQQEVVRKQQELEKEKKRLDCEFQLEKLRLENERLKGPLLKRFKLSAEIFRQKFVKHQRNPAQSWRDFVFEITSYFEEWLGGLGVNDFDGLKNLMITDQLKRRVPGDIREQIYQREVVTTRVSIPVSVPINTRNGIDDLQLVDIKCGQTSIKAVIDTGAQISVLREDLIGKVCGEGEGSIQIISAFGEKEIAALKLFNLKIDDGKHGSMPIIDFEGTKDEDIEFRKEKEDLRKETENEARIREARHKEEEQARLKAEVEARLKAEQETKAVEERRRMEEERRMNERIALEDEIKERKMACGRADTTCSSSEDSSNVLPIFAEDETYAIKEKPKLPKRKFKELSRMSVTKLQRKVNLKTSNNIVLVPQHWSFKREYSQDKRGIGTLAWKLPGFIKRIGIGKVRQSLREREDQETAKVKMRKRVRLKLRTHDNISWDFLNDV